MTTPAAAKKATAPRKTTTTRAASTADDSPVSSGSQKMDALVKALEDVELTDQHSLNAFCEALRKLSGRLAVETAIGSGQLTAGAKAMAKGSGNPFLMGLDVKLKMRRVTRALDACADHLGSAAAAAVTAWTTFETEFEEVLNKSARKPSTPKSFHIAED